jgi:ribonuclease BN (tRNA processing enzyme)
LGTNSKYPTPQRNVSGILIETDNAPNSPLILLDCGGGTYEQFLYHYSPELL